ncbi:MAG TPA: efflux RND transporter periplasmic adaptor subunit [Azoarcus sp.]|nr:efflux RND transporter periplasmic adaptor subunit [Azoarcus sp.]
MPTKRPRLVLIACIVLALVFGAWLLRTTLFGNGNPSDAYIFATVERADLEDLVTATGTLQPREYVDVGAQVSGTLDYIHVEVGDEVEQDQLLAEIDPRVLRSRVEATRAQLRSQQAQLIERQANLELAEIQHRRQKNLMAADATSRESLQTAAAALRSARAQVTSLEAQIEQTQSNLSADEANLEYTRIVAPMRGTVVSIEARQGQTLNANQQAPNILRIADLSVMSVETEVSEADVGRLRIGMDVWFTTLGGNNNRWEGTLRRIDPTPTVTNNVVLYNALFDVPNPDRRLMTQMTAQVFFVIARAENTLTVPLGALSNLRVVASEEGQTVRSAQVRVADAAGRVTPRTVEVGMTSRVSAQILSGLAEGERVVAGLNTDATAGNNRSAGSR